MSHNLILAQIEYEHAGLPIQLKLRHRKWTDGSTEMWWTGYVGVPESHPDYNTQHTMDIIMEYTVHGGISFVERVNDVCWIGFDCKASLADSIDPFDTDRWKTQEYAALEAERLAEQLKKAAQ